MKAIHEWDAWLDFSSRNQTKLYPGQDFTCSIATMRAQAHKEAQKRGLQVSVRQASHVAFDEVIDPLHLVITLRPADVDPGSSYPWDKWLFAPLNPPEPFIVLKKNIDYFCSQETMIRSIYREAVKRGADISVKRGYMQIVIWPDRMDRFPDGWNQRRDQS